MSAYEDGKYENQIKIDGKNVVPSKIREMLESEYEGLKGLYKDCCDWVHPNYSKSKIAVSPRFIEGRYGFRGKQYMQKLEDYDYEDIINDCIPEYDFEEECDIMDYAIYVNNVILDLFKKIEEDFLKE